MKLSRAEVNVKYKIRRLEIDDKKLLKRLNELGLAEGNLTELIKISPLKASILIKVYNYKLSLRTDIADLIEVERV